MNSLSSLPSGSIIIAPTYLHPSIRKQLLFHKSGLLNIQILSYTSWLHSLKNTDKIAKETTIFEYNQILMKHINELTTYKHMLSSLTFLNECYDFILECKQFDIHVDMLPTTSIAQKEMKLILEYLMPIPQPIDDEKIILDELLSIPNNCNHLYIIDTYFDFYTKQCVIKLISHGATIIENNGIKPQIEFYHSTNMRQEIESCAQYIISHELLSEDITITLADLEYQPFFEQIFNRYQIPYTLLFHNRASNIVMQLKYLLAYYLEPTTASLLTVLESDVFKIPHIKQLCTYLRVFDLDIKDDFNHIHRSLISEDIINKIELEQLKKLEELADEAKQALLDKILQLFNDNNIESLLHTTYDMVTSSLPTNKQNIATCYAIESLMQNSLPYLKDKESLKLFLSLLETIQESDQVNELSGCLLTNLTHPLLTRSYHFVLGLSQSNYPAFPKPSSLFSQDYLDLIPYPEHKERYYLHTSQLIKNLSGSKHLILSYSQSDFNGKGKEAALEIERFSNIEAIKYPFITHNHIDDTPKTLSNENATSLYCMNHQLKGSISSFERYVGCHFSYFLRYGIRLREPLDYAFSNAKLGTLSHFVLEHFVSLYGKNYVNCSLDEVQAFIHLKLIEMEQIYPNMKHEFKLIELRLVDSMMNTLEDLKDKEEHTAFTPLRCEYAFEEVLDIDDVNQLILNGYIDRIDQYLDYIRIIDYKSSHKTLSETQVSKANQLQLLTYGIVAQKQLKKQCAGVYYQSLKSENTNAIAGKMNRRAKEYIPYNYDDYQGMRKNNQRLNGWHMIEDLAILDDDASHMSNLTINKDGIVNARKIYNLEGIEEQLLLMYQSIAKQIIDGDISINPDNNACTFCKYHDICRNKKPPIDKPILMNNDDIYIKGGGSYDDVE
ncbi:MAG: PD-(D/E)XK nuclease family protein [Erysipelotrichaceae bacterium]